MKFLKTVGLIDIGVTIATQWCLHAFYMSPIFSKSRPELLKWPYVSGRPQIGLSDCEVLKNSMRAFSNKSGWNIFNGKMKDSPWFLLIREDHFFPEWLRRPFYHILTCGIGLLTKKISFNLLCLISVEAVMYNVLILFILHKTVALLLQKVYLKN